MGLSAPRPARLGFSPRIIPAYRETRSTQACLNPSLTARRFTRGGEEVFKDSALSLRPRADGSLRLLQ